MALACPLVSLAVTGWFYIVRAPTAQWPGPTLRDSLPLNEQPMTDGVKLLVFVGIWIAGALVLAALARSSGFERLTAALGLASGVGVSLYLMNSISLFAVRSLPLAESLREATRLQPMYLAATMTGITGALLGRRRETGHPGAVRFMAWLVAAAGLLDIISAVTPEHLHRLEALARFAPFVFPRVADALIAAAGVALIVIARGLERRTRRAWVLSVGLLVASCVLNLMKGLDYEEAIIVALLAAALIARRGEFNLPGDPKATRRAVLRVVFFSAGLYVYGSIAALIERTGSPFLLGFAASHTTAALGHLARIAHRELAIHERWIPPLLAPLGLVAEASVVRSWLTPWGPRGAGDDERARATALTREWGEDSLAPFALRADHSYFFAPEGDAVLAYRVRRGVALISGDPIGRPEALVPAIVGLIKHARAQAWRVAVLGASRRGAEVYKSCGLRAMYWGDEAVVVTRDYSLEGRAIRKVRQSVRRVQRAGYRADVCPAAGLSSETRCALSDVERAWLHGRARHTSMMGMDELFPARGTGDVFAIGRDASGSARGFLHLTAGRDSPKTLSLSSMPRLSDTPNGFNEWLVCETIDWARARGIERISLNFAPFAALLSPDVQSTLNRRLKSRALRAAKRALQLQLDNLLIFNRKFSPAWEPRYVLFERRADLPRLALAALVAEGYLRRSRAS